MTTESNYGGEHSTHERELGETSETANGQTIKSIQEGPLGRKYAETEDGQHWTKTHGGKWTPAHGSTPPTDVASEDEPLKLYLTIADQVEGEPQHWGLFVAKENGRGSVYEVRGKQSPQDITKSSSF